MPPKPAPVSKPAGRKTKGDQSLSNHDQTTQTSIKKIEDGVYEVRLPRYKLYLVGTAHVSKNSVELVSKILKKIGPDTVYLELDDQRKKALVESKFKEINLIEIIRKKKVAFFIAYLILFIFQKRIADRMGTTPGGEFKKALQIAKEEKIKVILIDRDASVTVKRLWRKMSLREQFKLLFSFLWSGKGSSEGKEHFDEDEVTKLLKETDLLSEMVETVSQQFPTIKQVMIDERDLFMVKNIIENYQQEMKDSDRKKSVLKGVVIVGAGHLAGMTGLLEKFRIAPHELNHPSRDELKQMPPAQMFWKCFPWVFTSIVVAIFGIGFFYADSSRFEEALVYWVVINGVLSALGGVVALAHPVTILTCFVAAPITSLNPMIGAGMVTSLVQTVMLPPKLTDFENFSVDVLSLKKWWKNRITKVFLVFILSSLGSAVGTWVALTMMVKTFY